MTSGSTSMPAFATSQAASKIARACISVISGKTFPKRQPRKPSIGLNSCRPFTRVATLGALTPSPFALAALFRLHRLVDEHLHDFTGFRGDLAFHDFAGEAVDADEVALIQGLAAGGERPLLVVDLQRLAADDADLAHLS